MKDFFSRNYISILVGVLIVLGLLKYEIPELIGSSSSEDSLQKGDFKVHNHSAIHSIYFKGDLTPKDLNAVGIYMDNVFLFKNNQPAILGLSKENGNLSVMRMTTADFQKEVPEEQIYLYSQVALSIKNNLYPDSKINLQFTDDQWNPHLTLDEKQLNEKINQYQANANPGSTPTIIQNAEELKQILERWMQGASNLAQAKYYFPVQENDNWRIYYSDYVSEQVPSLAQVLFEADFFLEGSSNFIAFYTQADPEYFNGEASYVVAFPFTENQLNDGTANKTLNVIKDFFKKGYFSESNLMVVGTDYDFQPVLLSW
jgi:hypothetical protein